MTKLIGSWQIKHVLHFNNPLLIKKSLSKEKSRSFKQLLRQSLIGGAEGGRTPDLGIANAALCQTELLPQAKFKF